MSRIKAGVVGATGFTGSEIVRILVHHPEVDIRLITSESHEGKKFSDIHPFFQGIVDVTLHSADKVGSTDLDIVFLALPHGVSMEYVKRFADRDFRIVDFSGDFRLGSPEVYQEWYQKEHSYPEGFKNAVYGLPELFADEIRGARLVANPGCFPTGAILSLAPLVAGKAISGSGIIIDSKTGVTGAGIKPSGVNMFSSVNENFKAYGLKKHRHTIEIQGVLEKAGGKLSPVQFTPHLLPVDRGILTTTYARPDPKVIQKPDAEAFREIFRDFYRDKPFVRLCEDPPSIKDVRASNYCNIHVDFDERTGNVMVISAIDNLVKGAAGLAVQNMNIMLDLDETAGLSHVPVSP